MNKPKYGTVPIMLLQNIHTDQRGTIRKMFDYALYDRMRKNNPDFEHDDFEEPAMDESMEYFSLQVTDLKGRMNRGNELYDTFHGTPTTSVNIQILLEFQKEKTEFELMVFSFYCGVRSMVGTKSFLKTNNEYLLSRAFGYATIEDYQNGITTEYTQSLKVKYSERYHLDKIKDTLQSHWGMVYYSRYTRGFYVSFTMDLVGLINIAEDKKEKYKLKELEKKRTIQAVLDARKSKQDFPKNDVPF